jgi:hypothetical protein
MASPHVAFYTWESSAWTSGAEQQGEWQTIRRFDMPGDHQVQLTIREGTTVTPWWPSRSNRRSARGDGGGWRRDRRARPIQ